MLPQLMVDPLTLPMNPLDAFALASFTVASAPTEASAYSVTYATYYAAAGESARYESITGGCKTET